MYQNLKCTCGAIVFVHLQRVVAAGGRRCFAGFPDIFGRRIKMFEKS